MYNTLDNISMSHHSYNDEGICFSKEADLGTIMERKMQVQTLGVTIYTMAQISDTKRRHNLVRGKAELFTIYIANQVSLVAPPIGQWNIS